MKLTTLLGRDHRKVLRMLGKLERATRALRRDQGNRTASRVIVDSAVTIESEVAFHFASEEKLLFPRLDEIAGMSAGPLKMMRYEHERFRELVTAFQEQAQALRFGSHIDIRVLVTVTGELVDLLRDHIRKEDQALFPLCESYLGSRTLEIMGRVAESWPRGGKPLPGPQKKAA